MKRKHIATKILAMTIAATMCMGLSPTGSVLAASSSNTDITVYNIEGKDMPFYSMQDNPCNSMHPSANGQDLITTQEPATTQADTNTKDDKDTQSEAVTLNIDNENQYDGMEKPYAQGYVPTMPTARSALYFRFSVKGNFGGTHYGRHWT